MNKIFYGMFLFALCVGSILSEELIIFSFRSILCHLITSKIKANRAETAPQLSTRIYTLIANLIMFNTVL